MTRFVAVSLLCGMLSVPAGAQELIYTPINPSFGGNPMNSSHLMSMANAQRDATASNAGRRFGTPGAGDTGTDPDRSNADLFIRQLEGRLMSALAGQVTEAIFGANPQDAGNVTFGTTTISFERTLESIRLVIVDTIDGTVTEIVVPQLVTTGS